MVKTLDETPRTPQEHAKTVVIRVLITTTDLHEA